MYNRILKRPMFRRGGPSFQAQGTGITSPYDTPRRGLVQQPGGYAGRTFEDIQVDREAIFAPKPHENINEIFGSFGAYGNPYKDDGTAKTTGEMGYEQAQAITALRKEKEEKRQLAELTGLESEEAGLVRGEEQANEMAVLKQQHAYNKAIEKMRGENLEFERMIKNERKRADDKIAALDKTDPKYNENVNAIEAEFQNVSKQIIRQTPGMAELIQGAKNRLYKLHTTLLTSTGSSFLQEDLDKWNAQAAADNDPKTTQKTIVEWIQEQAVADVTGTTVAAGVLIQQQAKGGRVGYQMGTPQTGAMPNQGSPNIMAQATTDAEVEEAYGVSMDEGIEGQQASVQMPYQEFRASIPAEVSDEIVQLIYYNQDAFADFAQISTQADVYAFNNKYGVSLVLPMDTETT